EYSAHRSLHRTFTRPLPGLLEGLMERCGQIAIIGWRCTMAQPLPVTIRPRSPFDPCANSATARSVSSTSRSHTQQGRERLDGCNLRDPVCVELAKDQRRAKLAINPAPAGSVTCRNTIGTLRVAWCNGAMAGLPVATMTSGAS